MEYCLRLSGRQISRLLETGSQKGVSNVLERLRQQGLVAVIEAGNVNPYSLNREHVAAPAVEALKDLRSKLFDRMAEAIKGWRILPESVAIFGSAARGDGEVESDIDILIVRPTELHFNHFTESPNDEFEPLEDFSSICTKADAKVRLAAAHKYLESAEMLEGEAKEGIEESASVAA